MSQRTAGLAAVFSCLMVFGSLAFGRAQTVALTADDRTALHGIVVQTDTDFRDDVMPFWTRHTPDPQYGGYITVVDRYGKPKADTTKYLVMQARMVWTLCAAHEYGIRNRGYLKLAKSGVDFLTGKMWDPQYGGFYMSVKRDGAPLDTQKSLYAQSFVLYALSEYARVAKDPHALVWAERLYTVIQRRTADPVNGGYREDFDREWKPISSSMGVGGTTTGKTLNTHMHLMESFTEFVIADPKPKYKRALADLVDLLLQKSIAPQGFAYEPYTPAWQPKPDGSGRMSTFYGHNVEFSWLLQDAYAALGRPVKDLKTVVTGLIDHALAYGVDTERGGIGLVGPHMGKVIEDSAYKGDVVSKQWWEQAEFLTALIRAFRMTGDRKYLNVFEKEWSWVWKYQIDHTGGDWFSSVDWNTGAPLDFDKGLGGWKICYHNGRALMLVSQELRGLLRQDRARRP